MNASECKLKHDRFMTLTLHLTTEAILSRVLECYIKIYDVDLRETSWRRQNSTKSQLLPQMSKTINPVSRRYYRLCLVILPTMFGETKGMCLAIMD